MSASPDSLRKVAIVLASLDTEAAELALIERMPDERARQVRQALTELEQLDPAEQEAVVGEFLRQGQAAKQADLAGVEVEAGLARALGACGTARIRPVWQSGSPPPAAAASARQSTAEAMTTKPRQRG